MLGDKVRIYRVKNWVKTVEKTERILRDAGLQPKAVPPRLLIPIVSSSSIEEDETLQELWAGLLATSSQEADSISPSFVETLKQLTPDEARHLDQVCMKVERLQQGKLTQHTPISPWAFTDRWEAPASVSSDVFERLGLIRRDYDVKLINVSPKVPGPLESADEVVSSIEPEIRYQFQFTKYAIQFLSACRGPKAQANGSSE